MARMNTLHPLAFAEFKHWMSQLPGREPPKRGRDALQARVVEEVVKRYLPHLASGVSLPEIPQTRVSSAGVTTGLPAP